MKTWKIALGIGFISTLILVIVILLPKNYTVFSLSEQGVDIGALFPVMLCIWILALIAFAINNVFVDKYYIDNNLKMHPFLRYLPSIIGIPVFISFIWFLCTWLVTNPHF